MDVGDRLAKLGLSQYAEVFRANDIDEELSQRYAWQAQLGTLLIFRGVAKARCGLLDEAMANMKEGFAAWKSTSGNMSLSMWLVGAADAIIGTPRSSVAREWIQRARRNHDICDQQTEAADLLRVEALVAGMDGDVDRAEALYRQALSVSAGQSAKIPKLRAATGLAELLGLKGRQVARSGSDSLKRLVQGRVSRSGSIRFGGRLVTAHAGPRGAPQTARG